MRLKVLSVLSTFILFLCTVSRVGAKVERTDFIPLGDKLGFPVYEWKDNKMPTKAIIVGFHGMTFYGLALNDTAGHLAAEGYDVYAFDFRGFGHWRDKDNRYKNEDGRVHFSQSLEDGKKLINALHEQNPNTKIFCLGESLGSNLILWALTQETLPIDGAILCGLGVKNSLHPHPKWLVDFVLGLSDPNRPLNLRPYIKNNLATSKVVTNTYLHDPQIHNQLSSVELIKAMITNKKSIQNFELIPEDVPLLIISGQKDRIFKTRAVGEFSEMLSPEQTTFKLLPGRGHLLLELHPMDSDLANTIDTWLDNQIQIKQTKAEPKEQKLQESEKTAWRTFGNSSAATANR